MEALLNSGATELVMSKEFARKHKFRRMKLERPIYKEYGWHLKLCRANCRYSQGRVIF